LFISEEKLRIREILEKMNVIELKKIGSHLKLADVYDIKTSSSKPKNPESNELLIDFSTKLVINEEREFSSGFYDIKIYERTYKNSQMSYRFEISLAPPKVSDTFIVDFQCEIDDRK
jgi:hypothetical protein